ncbi:response regulator [Actinopolymorpha alba]|uniref:response regulator n=1 Tax=Actinopolymorpha alba TaxID=533267 RepID=UPI00036DEB7B|nr:response regulator transcription factor [Actinopolymorpha alba]
MSIQPVPELIRVLIVEDHPVVAEGMTVLLNEHPDLEVLGWAPSVAEAVRIAEERPVDVAVLDFWLADGSGADAAAGIRTRRPETAVVFVSADDSDQAMMAAIEAGASGYLLKAASAGEIADAVRRAADGEMLIPAGKLAALLARSRETARRSAGLVRQLESLTPREREILDLMSQGLDNRQIADRLSIAYPTVRSHVRKVLEKLCARSKLEAVVRASGSCDVEPPAD